MIALAATGGAATAFLYIIQAVSVGLIFFRDSLFGGAGPGKRMVGLRVVKSEDGTSPLTYGQSVVRWLSQLIPIFNLVDAAAAYSSAFVQLSAR